MILETTLCSLEIATGYQPRRRSYLPIHDLVQLFNKQHPVILMGDLNAHRAVSGYGEHNGTDHSLNTLIDRGLVQRLGPYFPTFYRPNTFTKTDIVLSNYRITYKYLISEGPAKTSDHVPILMKISTSPFQVEIPPRRSFRKANWTKYKNILNTHQQTLGDGALLNA